MVKIKVKDKYALDLEYDSGYMPFDIYADIRVNLKIKIKRLKSKVKLNLKGTTLHSSFLGEFTLKGEALKKVEEEMAKDIKEISDEYITPEDIDKVIFRFENYLKRVLYLDKKLDRFIRGNGGKLIELPEDILEELEMKRITKIGAVSFYGNKILLMAQEKVNGVDFGIVIKDDKFYVPERVYKKYLEFFLPID